MANVIAANAGLLNDLRIVLTPFPKRPFPKRPLNSPDKSASITEYLQSAKTGDPDAQHALLGLVYDSLRQIAANRLGRQSKPCTLHPTELVHEAWIRLGGNETWGWENRFHFFAAAAEAMRRTLIDNARRKQADKRGGKRAVQVDLPDYEPIMEPLADDLLDLHQALTRFEQHDPLKAQVVKLKFFAGMTIAEIAAMMELSDATIERYWAYAKAWLHQHMGEPKPTK